MFTYEKSLTPTDLVWDKTWPLFQILGHQYSFRNVIWKLPRQWLNLVPRLSLSFASVGLGSHIEGEKGEREPWNEVESDAFFLYHFLSDLACLIPSSSSACMSITAPETSFWNDFKPSLKTQTSSEIANNTNNWPAQFLFSYTELKMYQLSFFVSTKGTFYNYCSFPVQDRGHVLPNWRTLWMAFNHSHNSFLSQVENNSKCCKNLSLIVVHH